MPLPSPSTRRSTPRPRWRSVISLGAAYLAATVAISGLGSAARALTATTPSQPIVPILAASAVPTRPPLILLPDAAPTTDPYYQAVGQALGYDSVTPATEAAASPNAGEVPPDLSGKALAAYLMTHWQTLQGRALGTFAFTDMTARTLDPHFMGQELPLSVFRALPILYPKQFPDPRLANFGFIRDPDDPDGLPIGLKTGGVTPRYVGFTCAACHVGLVDGTLTYGAPNSHLEYGDLLLKMTSVLSDPGLSLDRIIRAAEQATHRPLTIAQKAGISSWLRHRPTAPQFSRQARRRISRWGPGRMDLVTGTGYPTRIPPLYGISGLFMADGLFADLKDADEFSLFARGLDHRRLVTRRADRLMAALGKYVRSLTPPPSPDFVDRGQMLRGARVFQQNCASCHFQHVGQVIPLEAVGTDGKRFRQVSVLDALAIAWSGFQQAQVRLWPMVKIPSLAGVWGRTALLHNGSVPTLDDLLKPPDERPPVFAQGGKAFDTALAGNSNRGHDFGTRLGPEDRAALLAYLRTL